MDTEHIELMVELLEIQIAMYKNLGRDDHNVKDIQALNKRASVALIRLVQNHGDDLHHWMEHTDAISRLTVSLDIKATVTMDEPLPDNLPLDIFAQLHGKSITEMMAILRDYGMPLSEIKPFLRRLFPADDAL